MTALRLIYLSPTFWRNYMAIREMGNNFRHDALERVPGAVLTEIQISKIEQAKKEAGLV